MPLIGFAVVPQRPGNRSGGVRGVPRLHPWAGALFKRGKNRVGDAAINVLFHGEESFLSGLEVFRKTGQAVAG
jgi:hypothetical protein